MGWVLEGIYTHGAPLAVHKMLVVREWGERNHYLVEMGLDNDPNVWERLYEKWAERFQFEKLHLYERRNPGDPDYNSLSKPKHFVLWKPWIPHMRPHADQATYKYQGPVVAVGFEKTAHHTVIVDKLKGMGYGHVGYAGDFSL